MKRRTTTIFAMILVTLAHAAYADDIQLLAVAGVEGDQVHLRDVARLDGARAEALGDLVVAKFDASAASLTVDMDVLRDVLTRQSINWGLLTLGGHRKCMVERLTAVTAPVPVIVAPERPIDLTTTVTLRQMLIERIERESGRSRSNMVIDFSDSEKAVLDASVLGRTLEIEPQSTSWIGRVPFTVREWRNSVIVSEVRVAAEVAARTLAVVATKQISRGTTISRDDVAVNEVMLHAAGIAPMTRLDEVVGKTAASIVRMGSPITADHIAAEILVRRNEVIEIRGLFGGVVIKLTARAKDDGAMGQIIMARRDGTRHDFPVRIVGTSKAIAVNQSEGFDVLSGKVDVQ